jgi:hypothetical protein
MVNFGHQVFFISESIEKKYKEVQEPAYKKYLEECEEIDNEVEEPEQEIIHNGHKYKLVEEKA